MDETLIRAQERELAKTGHYYKHLCWMVVPLLCVSCFLYGLRPLLLCGAAPADRQPLRPSGLAAPPPRLPTQGLLQRELCPPHCAADAGDGGLVRPHRRRAGRCPHRQGGLRRLRQLSFQSGCSRLHGGGGVVAGTGVPLPAQPYTNIPLWDASGVPVSDTVSQTLRSGGILNIGSLSLGLGEYAAPMGTGAALVILACGFFLWLQKDTRLSATVSFLVTSALIAFFFPRQVGLMDASFAAGLLSRLQCVRDELLTGAMLFSAVFLLNEPYTCAHHRIGRILYGVLVGAATMGFRYFGVYDTGVCFALLTVNSISGWLDRTETRLYRLLNRKEDAE